MENIQWHFPWLWWHLANQDIILQVLALERFHFNIWQQHSLPTFQSNRSRAISSLGFLSLAAATIPSPRGPHPLTTTTSSNCTSPRSTAWMEHASGSINTPFQGGMDLGTWGEREREVEGGRKRGDGRGWQNEEGEREGERKMKWEEIVGCMGEEVRKEEEKEEGSNEE